MDVSIIIVSWNTREVLRHCLKSIYEHSPKMKIEVIVVDNNSSDGSAQMVAKEFPQAQLIMNKSNMGFAAANNQAIRIAKGRYVLLLNSDTIVLDSTIAKTIAFADSNPRAAVVGCRVLNPDGSLQPSCFTFPGLLNMFLSATFLARIFPRSHFFGRHRMGWWDHADSRTVDVVAGCFILARREAINQIGMMDERFFMYSEEADWCYRFAKAGWQIWFIADAQVIHYGGESSGRQSGVSALPLHGSLIKYMSKHHPPIKVAIFCFMVSLYFGIRIPIWALTAILRKRGRQDAWQRCRMYMRGCLGALAGGHSLNIWNGDIQAGKENTEIASKPGTAT